MMEMSPLILVQFLKDSMLDAFTAMLLIRAPTPIPSQAEERYKLRRVLRSLHFRLNKLRITTCQQSSVED